MSVYKIPKWVRRALTNMNRLVIYFHAWVWGGNLSLCYNPFLPGYIEWRITDSVRRPNGVGISVQP